MDDPSPFALQPVAVLLNASQASYNDLKAHPERYYSSADIVWVMTSAALVFLMVPSLSLIYAGMGNRRFALTLFRLPLITCAFVGFQWALWGYTLAFTESSLVPSWWGGESRANALKDVLAHPIATGDQPNGPYIPELVYVLYEGMFASFTAALVCGGAMHHARPARFLAFITLWSLFVYIPVARWSWNRDGWSNLRGTMDFAGGTPVHIVSGVTVAAFAVFQAIETHRHTNTLGGARSRVLAELRSRREWSYIYERWMRFRLKILRWPVIGAQRDEDASGPQSTERARPASDPYNANYAALGTAILWFGWAGFNGGSALGGNLRAVSAWTATHVAACSGGTTGVVLTWIQKYKHRNDVVRAGKERKHVFDNLTVHYFCDGAIAGLVAITPGSGYVPIWSAAVFGIVSCITVSLLKRQTSILLKDDPLQIFAVHAGGGWVGMFLTGAFADATTIGLDGHSSFPGPADRTRGQRVGWQLVDALAGTVYTFGFTMAILYIMKATVYLARKIAGARDLSWWDAHGFDEDNFFSDKLEAMPQQDASDFEMARLRPRPAVAAGSVTEGEAVNGNSGGTS